MNMKNVIKPAITTIVSIFLGIFIFIPFLSAVGCVVTSHVPTEKFWLVDFLMQVAAIGISGMPASLIVALPNPSREIRLSTIVSVAIAVFLTGLTISIYRTVGTLSPYMVFKDGFSILAFGLTALTTAHFISKKRKHKAK